MSDYHLVRAAHLAWLRAYDAVIDRQMAMMEADTDRLQEAYRRSLVLAVEDATAVLGLYGWHYDRWVKAGSQIS